MELEKKFINILIVEMFFWEKYLKPFLKLKVTLDLTVET